MRVVLDTNVILAGFATRGLCEAVVALCLDQHELILSDAILSEVREHLSGKFRMPAARAAEITSFLEEHAEIVSPAEVPYDACRDADDRQILGTAVAGLADSLITGDQDLLSLGDYQGIPILSPREFYDREKR